MGGRGAKCELGLFGQLFLLEVAILGRKRRFRWVCFLLAFVVRGLLFVVPDWAGKRLGENFRRPGWKVQRPWEDRGGR